MLKSDVLLANFKPGTLEKLGLGAETLREINPRMIVVTGSALGESGPWSTWMGYGPLVRCVAGLTSLWRYPDDDGSFSDSTVIHPDHFAARVCAITTLAALIGRRQSGHGVRDRASRRRRRSSSSSRACWHPSRWRVVARRRPAPPGTRRPGACIHAPATTSGAS